MDIKKLLNEMSIDEKIAQLLQLAPYFFEGGRNKIVTGPLEELGLTKQQVQTTGSVLGNVGAEEMIAIQKEHLKHHQIPLIFMADVIHGYRTIFPIPLAIGCSFNEEMAEKCARVSAIEASASGVHVTFSPMADLVRDPRWGRVMESCGEDKYLNGNMAAAFVQGYQKDLSEPTHIASCVKHFTAYGACEGGRDYNTVDLSQKRLREDHLPSYKAAIDAGVKLVMTSFNTIEGVPSTGNKWLMKDVLRNELGFDGTVISDWGAVSELMVHGVAQDGKDCAQLAIEAGCDIEMMTSNYPRFLKELIESGKVDETLLDESVYHILKLKDELHLFEDPYRGASVELEKETHLCKEHRQKAKEVALESMVLLKNEGELPLRKDIQTLGVFGPFADSHDIIGGWRCDGRKEESVTLLSALKEKLPNVEIISLAGCPIELEASDDSQFEAVYEAAKKCDQVVLALGEESILTGEGGCRADITLPKIQQKLVDYLYEKGIQFAVVLFNGRPLEITKLSTQATAILETWYGGSEAGNAIAEILLGEVNPSGKLSMSFPYAVGQIPVYYNCYSTGRPKPSEDSKERYCSHYLDIPNKPLYPFGYGLSYTTFNYDNLNIDKTVMNKDDELTVSIDVQNTGNVKGKEVVQLYIRDLVGSVVRPIKELKGYQKIELQPNEKTTVSFKINEKMLRFYTNSGKFESEPGSFEIMLGGNSEECQKVTFELK